MSIKKHTNKLLVYANLAQANDTLFSEADLTAAMAKLAPQKVNLTIVAPHVGSLKTGVDATASYILASSVFYDAIFIGSVVGSANGTGLDSDGYGFIMEAYSHGKAIGAFQPGGGAILQSLGIAGKPGVYAGAPSEVVSKVLTALSGPVRFPQRFPTDDVQAICG